jgi:hypothetical protein
VVHGDYPSSLAKCCSSSGGLAMLAAMRRASSRVRSLTAARPSSQIEPFPKARAVDDSQKEDRT